MPASTQADRRIKKPGFYRVGLSGIGCRWKNSHIKSFAEGKAIMLESTGVVARAEGAGGEERRQYKKGRVHRFPFKIVSITLGLAKLILPEDSPWLPWRQ